MIDRKKLKDAVICKESDSILEVSRILRDTRMRHLIVVDSALKPLGVISTVDINNRVVSQQKNPETVTATDIMTHPLASAEVSSTYDAAYKLMIEKETYSLPVTEQGKLIGILDFNFLFSQLGGKKQ